MKNQDNSRKPERRNDTWAIRGIEPETRTAVTMAARRAGQTVGEYCNRALRDAATDLMKKGVIGPTIEESLMKLAESMVEQAAATQRQMEQAQQQNEALATRLHALERDREQGGPDSRGGILGRLYGLLWRPQAQLESTGR